MVTNCHPLEWLGGKWGNAYQMSLVLFIKFESKRNSGEGPVLVLWKTEKFSDYHQRGRDGQSALEVGAMWLSSSFLQPPFLPQHPQ